MRNKIKCETRINKVEATIETKNDKMSSWEEFEEQ